MSKPVHSPEASKPAKMKETEYFTCPNCGPRVAVDEDGCCVTCGGDTVIKPETANETRDEVQAVLRAVNDYCRPDDPGSHGKRYSALATAFCEWASKGKPGL